MVGARDGDGSGLDDEALLALIVALLIVGTETTAHMIAIGSAALARNPDQRALLLDGRVGIEDAVEELMRYESPNKLILRYAREALTIHDAKVGKGQIVMLLPSSANRDPDQFADPDRLDLTRDAGDHLSFGYGKHFCLGAWLARSQLRVGIGELVQRFPDLQVDEEGVSWLQELMFRGPKRLPVRRAGAARKIAAA